MKTQPSQTRVVLKSDSTKLPIHWNTTTSGKKSYFHLLLYPKKASWLHGSLFLLHELPFFLKQQFYRWCRYSRCTYILYPGVRGESVVIEVVRCIGADNVWLAIPKMLCRGTVSSSSGQHVDILRQQSQRERENKTVVVSRHNKSMMFWYIFCCLSFVNKIIIYDVSMLPRSRQTYD